MWKFVKSALERDTWLDTKGAKQVCFWGRSNVGKSSLLNAIVNQKISYVSKQPGRTQLINYFEDDGVFIIDFPGYGYAQMSKSKSEQMNRCIKEFIVADKSPKNIFLLIDSRTGLTQNDYKTIEFLKKVNWNFDIVYTKMDKLNQKEKSLLIKKHNDYISKKLFKDSTSSFLVSSEKNIGLDELIEYMQDYLYS
ncbi:ribosome biogenesis GTP-binding protein YsxC [Mycoplasmopsis maculosa]|uniref:Probable GTP-binding protein EngB n=1 Tax=Mycoplasmopsis maculosa TaxID=114885 RepID=A0A449B4D3_9BACT|nr:ribosome biogenesis GTP-binding protein YihA/YsxC [Mycoplasmopsis maculosa]VEU75464.1 ribosome biogenesis GTP-binding protein YsxC [Mycoplasmopsis maculosa]